MSDEGVFYHCLNDQAPAYAYDEIQPYRLEVSRRLIRPAHAFQQAEVKRLQESGDTGRLLRFLRSGEN